MAFCVAKISTVLSPGGVSSGEKASSSYVAQTFIELTWPASSTSNTSNSILKKAGQQSSKESPQVLPSGVINRDVSSPPQVNGHYIQFNHVCFVSTTLGPFIWIASNFPTSKFWKIAFPIFHIFWKWWPLRETASFNTYFNYKFSSEAKARSSNFAWRAIFYYYFSVKGNTLLVLRDMTELNFRNHNTPIPKNTKPKFRKIKVFKKIGKLEQKSKVSSQIRDL